MEHVGQSTWTERTIVRCPRCGQDNMRRLVHVFGTIVVSELVWCGGCLTELPTDLPILRREEE